jgi:hypothetical protein
MIEEKRSFDFECTKSTGDLNCLPTPTCPARGSHAPAVGTSIILRPHQFLVALMVIVFQLLTISELWYHSTVIFMDARHAPEYCTIFCSTLSPRRAGSSKGSI